MGRTDWVGFSGRLGAVLSLLACSVDVADAPLDAGDVGTGGADASDSDVTGGSSGAAGSDSDGGTGPKLDVGTGNEACTDQSGEGAPGNCTEQAPVGAFEPVIEWTWGTPGQDHVWATPLVGNLTDDNGDGVIDLCDTPDVVVMTGLMRAPFVSYSVTVLDGAGGGVHWSSAPEFRGSITPAMADIDHDDEIEIVTIRPYTLLTMDKFRVVALDTDGAVLWEEPPDQVTSVVSQGTAIEIADLDNDGDVEILAFRRILDHHGNLVAELPLDDPEAAEYYWVFPLTVDLDGDDDLEVVVNGRAYHHDGTLMWEVASTEVLEMSAVADFDDDGRPEILTSAYNGTTYLVEDDGAVIWSASLNMLGGTTIIDIDATPPVEFGVSAGLNFFVSAADSTPLWMQPVDDASGISTGTAFDFLGDGTPDVIFGDESDLHVWDSMGTPLFTAPRGSATLYEYPTVADVDNDGSADVVVVSNDGDGPPLQVIRDKQDRWVRARRIYNQYNYRITNISEAGKVPAVESKNWDTYNNFRVQAQISASGSECIPPAG